MTKNIMQNIEKAAHGIVMQSKHIDKDIRHLVAEAFKQFLEHFQGSGSSVGRPVNEVIAGLHQDFSEEGRLDDINVADVATAVGSIFVRVSSGVLAGIADSLDAKHK